MRELISESPRHGDRGLNNVSVRGLGGPVLAISREPGSRSPSIARALARQLDWPLYDTEALGYLLAKSDQSDDIMDRLDIDQRTWVEEHLEQLRHLHGGADTTMLSLARLVLGLACPGRVVFLGSGAGFLVPRLSVLHVGIVGRRDERLAEIQQTRRLTPVVAASQLAAEEERRHEFLHRLTGAEFAQPDAYDLMINSSSLGEETCVLLTMAAMRNRFADIPFAV